MRNIRLTIEYDGSPFMGWQFQPNGPTVQGWLETAIAKSCGRRATVYGSSRTDSGVHALGQVATFNVDNSVAIPGEKWAPSLNSHLPPEIRVVRSEDAPGHFHAQKNVYSKIYMYRLNTSPVASAIDRRTYWYPWPLDWERICQSLPMFVGEKDFIAFRTAGSPTRTTVRRIFRFELEYEGPDRIRFVVEGSGFLKQMVRTMVGTLIEVGEGKRTPESLASLFQPGATRHDAGRTLPGHALFLMQVKYRGE